MPVCSYGRGNNLYMCSYEKKISFQEPLR
jgi:hypothetical protein